MELMQGLVTDWRSYLLESLDQGCEELKKHESTGRPLGDDRFVEKVGVQLGRDLIKRKPGPKRVDDS